MPPRVGVDPASKCQQPMEQHEQNTNLKAAWWVQGISILYDKGLPLHNDSHPNKKHIVPPGMMGERICLPMALKGLCYNNCKGKHDVLSPAKVRRVAQVGGFTVEVV